MHRFFVSVNDIADSTIEITDSDDIKHAKKVLRLKPGDNVEVSDSAEWEYRASIISINDDSILLNIIDKQKFAREPAIDITLFQGVPKQGKMETIIQKNTELGVKQFVPVFFKRCVVTDNGKFAKKIQRWQKVAAESVKQCRRGIIPEVAEAVSTKEMLEQFKEYDFVLFPYENEENITIKDVLIENNKSFLPQKKEHMRVAVIIGPEGGFSEQEADEIVEAGGKSVSLGKTILRTETAGMAAVAMIMYEFEM